MTYYQFIHAVEEKNKERGERRKKNKRSYEYKK